MTNKKRNTEKKLIQAKISMIESKLEELTNYAPETYSYLMGQLDTQGCLLIQIIIAEEFERMQEEFESSLWLCDFWDFMGQDVLPFILLDIFFSTNLPE